MKRPIICLICLICFSMIVIMCPVDIGAADVSSITEVTVGIPVEEHPELFLPRSMPTHGEGRIAVFLIDFPDYKGLTSVEHYESLYFGKEVGQASVFSFYADQSYGKLSLDGEVFDWYTAKHDRSYYDNRKVELVLEAAEFYRAQGVDFSKFDGDGDGVLDALSFHFAGEVDHQPDGAWYEGVTYSSSVGFGRIGEMKLISFIQMDEGARMSTVCHELGHTLGLPDLYNEKLPDIDPLTDLMSKNLLTVNPYFRLLLGWEDEARIVTSATDKVRLEPDDFVIVTDEFNGFFDEFYIVTYRLLFNEGNAEPVVLRVDARLNESGTGFMNSNYTYDPTPEVDDSSPEGDTSKYLFIEELSFSPFCDRILNNSDHVFAGEDSILGPNSVPSSDTHDGVFTGLRMDTFLEYGNEYMTFNVSFVKDTESPAYIGGDDEISFSEVLNLTFNEYIYEGTAWGDIKLTDVEGNPMNATVIVAHDPHHKLKIIFNDDAYKDGYYLHLPENSLCDSSGNGIQEISFSISADDFLFSSGELTLPNIGIIDGIEYNRYNGGAKFFHHENDFTVITPLGAGKYLPSGAEPKYEFAKLDYNGNLLQQTLIDNPFKDFHITTHYIVEAADGSYVFFCGELYASTVDLIFCVDKDGVLKWVNDDYHNTTAYFYGYSAFRYGDGLACSYISSASGEHEKYDVIINTKTGELTPYNGIAYNQMFNLTGGRLLRVTGVSPVRWELIDSESYELLAYADFTAKPLTNDYIIQYLNDNGDGTITVVCSTGGMDNLVAFLLDADMNIIKSKEIANSLVYDITWLKDGGFCVVRWARPYVDQESLFCVYRYDRLLNLVWKEDVLANFIHHFVTPSGDILAYKSMYQPTPECYIVSYESETEKIKIHQHTINYVEERAPTCVKNGISGYWHCKECGVIFTEKNGSNVIINISNMLTLATGHVEEIIPATPASCIQSGNRQGIKCAVCDDIIVTPTVIPQWDDHKYKGDWILSKRANCMEEGEYIRYCAGGCGLMQSEKIPIEKDNHMFFGDWVVVKEADCINEGLLKRECKCGYVMTSVIAIGNYHTFGNWTVVQEATCIHSGLKMRTCTLCGETEALGSDPDPKRHKRETIPFVSPSCNSAGATAGEKCKLCGEILQAPVDIPPSDQYHIYSEWITVSEVSCNKDGIRITKCTVCDKELERITEPASDQYHVYGQWITIAEASCIESGSRVVKCTVCDCELDKQTEPPNDKYHVWGEWITLAELSCHEEGIKVIKCTVCDKELKRHIEPPSDKFHVWGEWITLAEVSCNKEGLRVIKCTVCDQELDRHTDPPSDKYHVAGEWKVTKEPTESEFGVESQFCRECGNSMNTRSIEKLPPSHENQNGSTANNGSSQSSGCAGTMGISAIIMIVPVAACITFILKKKEVRN